MELSYWVTPTVCRDKVKQQRPPLPLRPTCITPCENVTYCQHHPHSRVHRQKNSRMVQISFRQTYIEMRNNMSRVRKELRQPHEDHDDLAQLSSWNAWSLRRKRSTQNLLDDLIIIDPIIQKHMTQHRQCIRK